MDLIRRELGPAHRYITLQPGIFLDRIGLAELELTPGVTLRIALS